MRPSWNPLKITGTALPPNVLFMVKAIALGLILKGYVADLPQPHVPFLSIFDIFAFSRGYQITIQVMFVIASVFLFFNRYVRTCCIVLALIIFTSVLASRFYYSNNKLFCACMFFLAGLLREGEKPILLRIQIALMYFGAGFNKILDVEWRTGEYFHYWLGSMIKQPYYTKVAQKLPALMFAKIMSWATIITEFLLCIGFSFRKLYIATVWLAIYFHSVAMVLSTKDFGIYTTALLAAYLVFLDWPTTVKVFYKEKGLSLWIKRVVSPLMWDGILQWSPLSADALAKEGIAEEYQKKALIVKTEKNVFSGFIAFKTILLYWPVFLFLVALLFCSSKAQYVWWRTKGAEALLIIFCPVYDLIYFWWKGLKKTKE